MLVYPTYPTFPTFGEDSWQKETLVHLNRTGVSLTRAQIATIDANIRAIRFGSTATLSALTGNLSTIAGTAFISNPSVDLRPYIGFKITLSDGAQSLVGWIKAAGTGETYESVYASDFSAGVDSFTDASLDASGNNDGITDGTTSKDNVLKGIAEAAANCRFIRTTMVIGACYRVSLDFLAPAANTTVDAILAAGVYKTSAGTWTTHLIPNFTSKATAMTLYLADGTSLTNSTVGDILYIHNLAVSKILTPSLTGVTIVSTQGGTTYNWTSDGGINVSAASFTATITKE